MAARSDELLDFLLSGIAICGLGGATSADFRRIINEYYHKQRQQSTSENGRNSDDAPKDLGRNFYEQVWQWVIDQPDVRIYYKSEPRSLSLSEFEALERQDGANTDNMPAGGSDQADGSPAPKGPVATNPARPSTKLLSLGNSLRQRLLAEGNISGSRLPPQSKFPSTLLCDNAMPGSRELRKVPKNVQESQPAFDEPDAAVQGPRLRTSQNQTWIAITGHPIDLNKVPGSEFVLLAIIATSGPSGISQPELQKLSGQDKRSVPARTDSLYKKGYIDKRPIQWGKARTSLCTHKMYLKNVQEDPKSANDVFGVRTLSLTGLLFILNKLLESTSVVQVRHLRKKLGVTVERWNGRAVRGALIRLEQTGYLRRFTVEKKNTDPRVKSNHFICVQRLREPIEDDIKNLKFKRIAGASTTDTVEEEPLEDENAGDGSMQELEQNLMNDVSDDEGGDVDRRIPPQWTPDQLLTSLVVDAVDTAGTDGTDAAQLRDLTTGIFWKRPIESLLTRLTDGWDKNQPRHVRHLAIVRDTAMANDKKRVHYLYRTHQNFQKAADAGEVTWDALELEENKKGARSKKQQTPAAPSVDSWGFRTLNTNDFHRRTGSSSLSESCAAIVTNRRAPRDWEAILLAGDSPRKASLTPDSEGADLISQSPSGYSGRGQKGKVIPRPLLTLAERQVLGLPAKGRLGADYESQIRAHRKKTGNPNSIPEKLLKGVHANEPKEKPKYERRPGPPLLTREQRKARGLPEHGRLSYKVTEQILKEQGRNESLTHMNSSLAYGARGADGEEELVEVQDAGPSTELGDDGEQIDSHPITEGGALPDAAGSQDGVPELSQQLNDTSAEALATPQSMDVVTEQSTPKSQRVDKKRPIAEDARKSGRSKKKPRRSSNTGADPALLSQDHSMEQPDGFVDTGPPSSGLLVDVDPGFDTNVSVQTATQQMDHHNVSRASNTSATDGIGAETGDPDAASETPKTSAKGRRSSYKKASKLKQKVPLTKAELHVQATRKYYDDRVEPGLYIDPFATKPGKGGRGRPRKMFIATFKLPGLHKFDWFVPESGDQSASTAPLAPAKASTDKEPASPPPSASYTMAEPRRTPSTEPQTNAIEQQLRDRVVVSEPSTNVVETHIDAADIMDTHETMPIQASASAPIDPGTPMEVDEPSELIVTSSEVLNESPGSLIVGEQRPEVLNVAEALRRSTSLPYQALNDQVEAGTVDHTLSSERSASQTHSDVVGSQEAALDQLEMGERRGSLRLPPAMEVTTPARTTPYQSPYGPAPSQEPRQVTIPNQGDEVASIADGRSHNTASQDAPLNADGDVAGVGTPAKASQKKEVKVGRGVILGKGSVAHARARIIRHILDLCGGVFPGTEVMYPVFASVWEELGPKTVACPIPGTIRRAIIDLCIPSSDLREVKFTVPRRDLPGNKTRSVFFYKNLQFNSPEVQSVVKGVIQAYPEKYCPPGVQKYWREEVKTVPVLPKVDNSYLVELYPPTSRKLDERIKEARKERRRLAKEALELQRRQEKAAKQEAKRLANDQKRQEKLENSGSRRKLFKERQRLGGLNDRPQAGIANLRVPPRLAEPSVLPQQSAEVVPASDSSDEEPLINTRPRPQASIGVSIRTTASPQDDQTALQKPSHSICSDHAAALMSPKIGYHPTTHTFSTDLIVGATKAKGPKKKSRKRVRIEQPADQASRKRPRQSRLENNSRAKQSEDDFLIRHHIEIQESSDENDDDDEQGEEGRMASPTIAQRLAGLTGDPNKPDYEPATRKRQPGWSEPRDRRRRDRTKRKYVAVKDRRYPEAFDPLGEFRKLCYTLIIASSMAGEDGNVDWNIVKKVYSQSPRFDLEMTKKKWAWMQKKMAAQLQGMTGSFQSQFLSAYEEGKVDPIEDPGTYDWDRLVRWALLTCTYLEPPLPLARSVLDDCQFDLSSYDVLDRSVWYNTSLANINRDERFVKYTFGSPLHGKRKLTTPGNNDDLKARSLIRANISTPKELYDKTLAHDKLRKLPEPVIARSVNDLVQASLIKQRKIKRLLPGRNYHFSPGFAKNYRRTFELSDFMIAVQLKKDLDATFMDPDPEKRTYFVSRAAENATAMALISLASEGKVKLVPQLPPTNNDFNAPIPRISVWGFSEGDYQHRLMDRKRLFWPLAVVPTSTYSYGNPLRPTPPPPTPPENFPITWNPLPEPPLPAREQDSTALLPIWSTIDGQTPIYPWWHRILSIVLQALLFQPSITAHDIFSRCETYTTEVFELQLVLDWLVAADAATRSPRGTYELRPGYWGVFGDRLVGEEEDEFGEHVKRVRASRRLVDTWRSEYNREYNLRSQRGGEAEKGEGVAGAVSVSAGEQILGNVRKQYTIVKHALQNREKDGSVPDGGVSPGGDVARESTGATREEGLGSGTSTAAATPGVTPSSTTQDVDMTDADADAEGDDVDAEGESDDEYL